MSLDHAILGFLTREPMSGYDLKTKCFDREVGRFWTADQAQVYRTLDRLVKESKVSLKRVRQRGKPDRKLYSITPLGRKALSDWLRTPEDPLPYRDPFLLKLFFASELTEEEILGLLSAARDAYQARLEDLRSLSAGKRGSRLPSELTREEVAEDIALSGAVSATRAAIDFIDDSTERVREASPASRSEGSPETGGRG